MTKEKEIDIGAAIPESLMFEFGAALALRSGQMRVKIHKKDAVAEALRLWIQSGTGTAQPSVALPQAVSVDTVSAIAEAESLLSGAASVLRKLRESADGIASPNQNGTPGRTNEEAIGIAEALAPETRDAHKRPMRRPRKQSGNKAHPVGDEKGPQKLKERAG